MSKTDQTLLIIINGIPGTGKTTLAKQLSAKLGIPHICGDDIKELLFDKLGEVDIEWSRELGDITTDMLFDLVSGLLARGRSIIVEGAFVRDATLLRLTTLLTPSVAYVEIYCKTDAAVRRERFSKRARSGERHPGHFDTHYEDMIDDEMLVRHAPIAAGPVIEVDTTQHLAEDKVDELIRQVQKHTIHTLEEV